MKISIEANEETHTVYGNFGRRCKSCSATIGGIKVSAPTKQEAASLLKLAVRACTLNIPPRVRILKDGRVAVAYLDTHPNIAGALGWRCQMYHPDGRRGGSMGADLAGCSIDSAPHEVDAALSLAFAQHTDSIDDVT